MKTHKPLLKDADGEDVYEHMYSSMIGSLLYLTFSRPDIIFVDSPFDLVAFTDSDYAGASLDRKSTTGGYQFLGYRLISWPSKKQTVVANSTTEAEYIVASNCCGQTIDFLNAHPIKYALTVNPTINVSYIEQFWFTAKAKTINEEIQIHAIVDGKKIVIVQSSVRSDLQLADDDGIDYETVTKEREDIMERAATTAFSLEAEQDNGNINRTQSMATLNEPSPQGSDSGSGPRCQDTILGDAEAQTRFETASKQSNNPPLSRVNTLGSKEDRLKLKELIDLCTKLSDRVLDLETTKTAQAKEIASLKKRVKKLERKRMSKTPGMNLFKIGTSKKRRLGEEDASKQGRNLKQGKHSLIFEDSDFDEEFDANMDEAIEQVYDANKDIVKEGEVQVPTAGTKVNTASAPVTTAGVCVSTTKSTTTASVNITTAEPITPPITTTTNFEDEDLTIAQTLVKIRSEKSKMVEQEKPLKKKDQINFDEEFAQRLQAQMQAELEEEERLAREREEDANIAEWDDVQVVMDVDYELAARLHAQEQEELTIEERSKLFVKLMEKRKKHFTRLIAEEQRRKPPTKAQKRNQMCNSFVPMDSEVVKGSKDRAEGSKTRAKGSSKRAGEDLQQESTKNKMLKNFDKEDLEVLCRIVKARFKKTKPVDYMDTFLLLTLMTMFEHHVEDEMYPLTNHTLHRMFNDVKLQVDYECEMAFDLLRLVKK
ncbi:uncharacterized mitochondrial protein-like protein, partial [Tanacetum coccineum]